MKKFSIAVFIVSLLATQARAGTLTVNGSLTITTNLSAQSITVGSVTQTNLNFLPLQGYKYVIVSEGTNDLQRGNNLLSAYATATTLTPSPSNRVAVIIPPGSYNLSTFLDMNTSYVDLIGLVPAHMTSQQVFTNSAGSLSKMTTANIECSVSIYGGSLKQDADNVRIESITISNSASAYFPTIAGTNTVLRHVSMNSMSANFSYAGEYIDCVCPSVFSFGGHISGSKATGTFIDCVGGLDSFGGASTASGTFIDCTGANGCFGGSNGVASGVFVGCVSGDGGFGGNGTASGFFTACIGGANSFGGNGGTFSGTARLQHCIGGSNSFGSFNIASDDFNYNVGGANAFLMLPQLPTTTNGLPSGTVYNNSGALNIMP